MSMEVTEIDPSHLPTPRAIVVQVVRMTADPGLSLDRLGAVIMGDPAFTAELLRLANSPFYGLRVKVANAQRAVFVLGVRSVRNLAICFAVRETLAGSGLRSDDLGQFWEDSLRRAVAARLLAAHTDVHADDAFTGGLLQDFGMMALLRFKREVLKDFGELRGLLPDARLARERTAFGISHDQVARTLGARWGLPDALMLPLAFHHDPNNRELPAAYRPLARLCQLADTVAAVYTAVDKRVALAEAHAAVTNTLGVSRQVVDELLAALSTEVEEAAVSLGMRVQKQPAFEDILREANRSLMAMNLSYEELTVRLERVLAEKDAFAAQLQRALDEKNAFASRLEAANAQLNALAHTDALTGLSNRRCFEDHLRTELNRASRAHTPLSFVMIDLDKFKNVNDTYGHPFGDTVLTAVAGVLQRLGRTGDVTARLGGEELALLLPETPPDRGGQLAESVRRAIVDLSLMSAKGPVRVSASFGGATFHGHVADAAHADLIATALMETADRALYVSKDTGRNRVTWGRLAPPDPHA